MSSDREWTLPTFYGTDAIKPVKHPDIAAENARYDRMMAEMAAAGYDDIDEYLRSFPTQIVTMEAEVADAGKRLQTAFAGLENSIEPRECVDPHRSRLVETLGGE